MPGGRYYGELGFVPMILVGLAFGAGHILTDGYGSLSKRHTRRTRVAVEAPAKPAVVRHVSTPKRPLPGPSPLLIAGVAGGGIATIGLAGAWLMIRSRGEEVPSDEPPSSVRPSSSEIRS